MRLECRINRIPKDATQIDRCVWLRHLMKAEARKRENLMSRQSARARFNQLIKLIGNQNICVCVYVAQCKSKIVSFAFYKTGHNT